MTWNFSGITFSAFTWPSWGRGVLVVAFGSLRREGFRGRYKFAQVLFIAPSIPGNSGFIRNDVFGFTGYSDDVCSITPASSPDITTDNNNDPISLNNVTGIQDLFLHFYLESVAQVFDALIPS